MNIPPYIPLSFFIPDWARPSYPQNGFICGKYIPNYFCIPNALFSDVLLCITGFGSLLFAKTHWFTNINSASQKMWRSKISPGTRF